MAIDSFDIRVPSVIETEGDFNVEVRALDASGNILISDSTTTVQLIPSDSNIVFDGDGDGTYGEPGDDQKTLTNGIAVFPARDLKAGTFTVTVQDTGANTGFKEFDYSFNCLILPYRQTDPPEGSPVQSARQFFSTRDQVASLTEDDTLLEGRNTSTQAFSQYSEGLKVYFSPSLDFKATDIAQGDGTTVETLPNSSSVLEFTQSTVGARATFNTNEINGQPVLTFDGDDFYDGENSPGLLGARSNFTVVAAVRLLQSGGVQTILAQYEEGASNGKIVFRYDGGFEILAGNDGVLSDLSVKTAAQTINVPLYVLFERKDDTYTIAVNGSTLASTSDGETREILQTGNIVGARSSSGAYNANLTDFFPSDLLYLRIFEGTFSARDRLIDRYDFEDLYGLSASNSTSYISNMQSTYAFDYLYPHDDPQGGSLLRDVSGNGVHGFNIGCDAQETPLLTDGGTSFEYGPGSFVDIPDFSLGATTGRTFHFWISSTDGVGSVTGDQYLFDHQTPRLALYWDLGSASGFLGEIGIYDSAYRSFGVSLPRAGAVTLVSFVFSGASCELYLNGVSQGSIACNTQLALTQNTTVLGSRYDKSTGSLGTFQMDAVLIKNAAQTGPEVLDVYNDGIV